MHWRAVCMWSCWRSSWWLIRDRFGTRLLITQCFVQVRTYAPEWNCKATGFSHLNIYSLHRGNREFRGSFFQIGKTAEFTWKIFKNWRMYQCRGTILLLLHRILSQETWQYRSTPGSFAFVIAGQRRLEHGGKYRDFSFYRSVAIWFLYINWCPPNPIDTLSLIMWQDVFAWTLRDGVCTEKSRLYSSDRRLHRHFWRKV